MPLGALASLSRKSGLDFQNGKTIHNAPKEHQSMNKKLLTKNNRLRIGLLIAIVALILLMASGFAFMLVASRGEEITAISPTAIPTATAYPVIFISPARPC